MTPINQLLLQLFLYFGMFGAAQDIIATTPRASRPSRLDVPPTPVTTVVNVAPSPRSSRPRRAGWDGE